MKRSSCLSALLVSLSLTTASAALAAPPVAPQNPPAKQVALNAQPSSDSTPSTGAPSTAPAPSDEPSTSTPAVSVGTGTPAPVADKPAEAAAEPARKPKARPFAGSSLFLSNSMNTNTVFRGQTQYADPTVDSTLYLTPRYAINEAFQIRARTTITYEYTHSDDTTTKHEPVLGDTLLQLYYRKIPSLPLGIQPAVALNAGLPTSKESRARTMFLSPGVTLQLSKGIEHFLGGEATILGVFGYTHPLYQSRNPEVVDPRPAGAVSCVGGNNCQDVLSGKMNTSDSLSYMLLFAPEWGKWNPGVVYRGSSQWAYHPKSDTTNPVDGTPIGRPAGFDPTNVRQSHYFSFWLDYNFNTWFTTEVGFWNEVAGIGAGGTRSNIIFDRYQDTRVYLGFNVQLDNLAKALQGGNEGEAGIVRAKNTKSPMWNF